VAIPEFYLSCRKIWSFGGYKGTIRTTEALVFTFHSMANSHHFPWENKTLAANGRPVRENFADWFRSGQVVNDHGHPKVVYHASYRDFDGFDVAPSDWTKRKNLPIYYFTDNPSAAYSYAGGQGSRIIPVYLSVQNIFDHRKKEHMDMLSAHVWDLVHFSDADWSTMEKKRVLNGIQKAGFDAMLVSDETGRSIAVFDPRQIKSAIGNSGLYSSSSDLTDKAADLALRLSASRARAALKSIPNPGHRHAAALVG
jgi:hypothetical protein